MRALAALLVAVGLALPAAAAGPARVMSANVCTDQLALLLARPGQLVSVTDLAGDPYFSVLHERAAGLPTNAGRAEEAFLARPDLIVTGTFDLRGLAGLARAAGIAVEEFDYTTTLDTIPDDMRRMGLLLGNTAGGDTLAADFERRRQALATGACPFRPTVVARGQNGMAAGAGTLTDSVLVAAGFTNLPAARGYSGITRFPLELLIESQPDLVLLGDSYGAGAASLADAGIAHPALAGLRQLPESAVAAPGALTCGGPFVLDVVEALARYRAEHFPCEQGSGS